MELSIFGYSIFFILLFFFYVFGATVSFLPVNTSKLSLVVVGFIFLLKYSTQAGEMKIQRWHIGIGYPLLLLCVISTFIAVFYGTYDYSVAYAYFIMFFEAFIGAVLFYHVFLRYKNFEQLLQLFVTIYAIQAIVILLMLLVPAFREVIFSIFGSDQIASLNERYGGIRGFGISGSVTYDLSVALSIGMMFCAYLLAVQKGKKVLYITLWTLMLISVLLTGRTGFLGVFFSALIILFSIKRKESLLAVWHAIYLFPLAVLAGWVAVRSYAPGVLEIFESTVVPYAFEMFLNFSESGEFTTSSSEKTANMYFPVSTNTFFTGDGYWDNPNGYGYYMNTDPGYMRHMLFYGSLISAVLYIYYISCFYLMWKLSSFYKLGGILVALLGTYYFTAHLKGDFLTGSPMNIKLFFVLLISLICFKKNHQYGYHSTSGACSIAS